MADELPDRLVSADDRSGWFASAPGESQAADEDDARPPRLPPEGAVIRLMGEDSVSVPLWDDDGLMFGKADELREVGVSPALAEDLVAWATAWQSQSGQPLHDARAAELVRRLGVELEHRYRIVHHP